MNRINSYDGVIPIQNSELPLFISQPIDTTVEMVYIIVMSIAVIPFIITDLYFAYNDKSCVDYSANNMTVKLRDYLIVSGFSGILGIVGAFICLYYESIIIKPKIAPMLKIIYTLFNLMWTTIGSIIFWGIMDNMGCSNSIYTYLTSLLIMKFIWFAYCLTKLLFM